MLCPTIPSTNRMWEKKKKRKNSKKLFFQFYITDFQESVIDVPQFWIIQRWTLSKGLEYSICTQEVIPGNTGNVVRELRRERKGSRESCAIKTVTTFGQLELNPTGQPWTQCILWFGLQQPQPRYEKTDIFIHQIPVYPWCSTASESIKLLVVSG